MNDDRPRYDIHFEIQGLEDLTEDTTTTDFAIVYRYVKLLDDYKHGSLVITKFTPKKELL